MHRSSYLNVIQIYLIYHVFYTMSYAKSSLEGMSTQNMDKVSHYYGQVNKSMVPFGATVRLLLLVCTIEVENFMAFGAAVWVRAKNFQL